MYRRSWIPGFIYGIISYLNELGGTWNWSGGWSYFFLMVEVLFLLDEVSTLD